MPPSLEEMRSQVEAEMWGLVQGSPPELYDLMRYHLGWLQESSEGRGKGLRPLLCLLACRSVSGDHRRALPAAAAVELLHNFTLIHDDIEDGDRERRHRPTLWVSYGLPLALNAGDAMHVLSQLALLRLKECGVADRVVLDALALLLSACRSLCEGQHLDMAFESQEDVSLGDYLEMIERKTAALFACAPSLGALVGGATKEEIDAFASFGRQLGFAFQMQDDYLGIWGREEHTGKPTASDIVKKKKTLPIVYALSLASPDVPKLRAILKKKNAAPGDITTAISTLDNLGAKEFTLGKAREHLEAALAALEGIADRGRDVAQLGNLIRGLLGRAA